MDRNESKGIGLATRLKVRWKGSELHTECLFDVPIRIVLQGRPGCLRFVSYSTKHILAYAVGFKVCLGLDRGIFLTLFYTNMTRSGMDSTLE